MTQRIVEKHSKPDCTQTMVERRMLSTYCFPLYWRFNYENISSSCKVNGIFMHIWQRIVYPGVPEFGTGSLPHVKCLAPTAPRGFPLFPRTWFVVWMARCRRRSKPRKSLAPWLDSLLSHTYVIMLFQLVPKYYSWYKCCFWPATIASRSGCGRSFFWFEICLK